MTQVNCDYPNQEMNANLILSIDENSKLKIRSSTLNDLSNTELILSNKEEKRLRDFLNRREDDRR